MAIAWESRPITDPTVVAHLEAALAAPDRWSRLVWVHRSSRAPGQNMRMRPRRDRAGVWYIERRGRRQLITGAEVSVHDGVDKVFEIITDRARAF